MDQWTRRYVKYPWDALTEPGNYFVVPKSVTPLSLMKTNVATRNFYYKGATVHTCYDAGQDSWVMLSEMWGYDTSNGILLVEKARILP